MWMVGCSDGSELNMSDSFNEGKLGPLIPRPTFPGPKKTKNSAIKTHHYFSCVHGSTDLFALNHGMATATEESKRDFEAQPLASSRWNPTPEQLQVLEDMYQRGTRTPTSEQIREIAAHLRRFGKIEGKNVFYWFQNHKARERQKRRRESETASEEQQVDIESLERKDSGLRRTSFEVEETKNWAPPSNCSTLSEESVPMSRAAVAAESRPDGWVQFEERELQHSRNTVERHATWQTMELSSSPPIHLINSITTKRLNTQNYSMLLTPNTENLTNHEDESRESQTLQLFPLRNDDRNGVNVTEKDPKVPTSTIDTNLTPNQFFEFLPLKKY